MVIGFDASRAFVSGRTGTENYSYQLLKNLAKIDIENHYLVYVRPGSVIPLKKGIQKASNNLDPRFRGDDRKKFFPVNFEFKEIRWPRLWTQGGLAKQTFQDRQSLPFSSNSKGKLDVLFVPAHTLPIFRPRDLKTIVTVHDLGAEYLPKMHQIKQRLYLKWITNYQLKKATKLIAVSEATKKDLIERIKIPANNIEVIHEGYDSDLFVSVKGDRLVDSLNKFELEKGKYFLYVGTIQPRKNLERIVKAFHSVIASPERAKQSSLESIQTQGRNPVKIASSRTPRNDKLVIVGSKGWLSDQIYALPKKLGIEDKVKFLGRVEDQDLPALYSGAIALTYPSLFEGFGLPILEAQACGCPVITSNLSSMPEVAGKGAILVDPYSVEEIAEAMMRVQGTGYRLQLIRDGLKNVKRFSWEKCARETLKVFENI